MESVRQAPCLHVVGWLNSSKLGTHKLAHFSDGLDFREKKISKQVSYEAYHRWNPRDQNAIHAGLSAGRNSGSTPSKPAVAKLAHCPDAFKPGRRSTLRSGIDRIRMAGYMPLEAIMHAGWPQLRVNQPLINLHVSRGPQLRGFSLPTCMHVFHTASQSVSRPPPAL